jgi:DNA-binding NtrC family response regulator
MPRSSTWGAGRPCLIAGVTAGSALHHVLLDAGLDADTVSTEAEALERLDRRQYAVALVAQRLGASSVRAIATRTGQHHDVPVIVLGTSATLQDAVDAMQQGAADFIPPPYSGDVLLERLKRLVSDAIPRAQGAATTPSLEHLGLVGRSLAMARVYATIAKVSRYKANVLLLGESGCGKELVARALHASGPRRKHLFVPINCATLGREILENELFGHERGAFTGANERKKGLFEMADGGTLMLDEIGELDPSTQAKLLRVLERNEFRRVGGTSKVKVDLGIIAATNRDLEAAIASGHFREDLYFRLKVVTILVPSLRERREDIPALIDAFIADFNRRNDGKIKGIAPSALRRLMEYDWPGNVRELKNAIESAAVLATSETIALADLEAVGWNERGRTAARKPTAPSPEEGGPPGPLGIPPDATLAEMEALLIRDRLAKARTKAEAARSLGIGLRTLYTKLQALQQASRPASGRGPRR